MSRKLVEGEENGLRTVVDSGERIAKWDWNGSEAVDAVAVDECMQPYAAGSDAVAVHRLGTSSLEQDVVVHSWENVMAKDCEERDQTWKIEKSCGGGRKAASVAAVVVNRRCYYCVDR